MEFKETTLKTEYLYKGKIIDLKIEDVILPDGKKAKREIISHPGGSSVICEKDGKILLVKQFRAPYKEVVLEIPAGKLNPGENPEETAIRELEEEGGIKAKSVTLLFKFYPSPGYTDEIIYVYKAEDFIETKQNLDEDEFLSSAWYTKEELKNMIENGEIKDGKTLIALLSVLK
jgi:ADP-ribose pyrophosphatase